jgi:Tle cognate immunity protein 4 C-terminal domain
MNKGGTRRIRIRLAACILMWCGACAGLAGSEDSGKKGQSPKANMSVENRLMTECVGRFQLAMPEVLSVAGRSQSINRVEVNTSALPAGGVEALWRERITRIRALHPPSGIANPVIREFDLQHGVKAVWYFANSGDDELHTVEAIKPEANHAVLVLFEGIAGKEDVVEGLLKNVLDAYVPQARQGFCVGYGAITSEPGINEHARISFDHQRLSDLEITVETQTVKEPDNRTFSNLDEEKQVVRALGGEVITLRDQTRSVAGLQGKEIWASVVTPHEPSFVRFTWHFAGAPRDSARPMINIKGIAATDQQTELQTIWEIILNSLRSVRQ